MPLYKFGAGDVFYNQIKAHPSSSFFIYLGHIYHQNKSAEIGGSSSFAGIPTGHVSLYEMNVDRENAPVIGAIGASSSSDTDKNVKNTGFIYPFVYKGLQAMAFKDMSRSEFARFDVGDVLTGSYQMSSSLVRTLYPAGAGFNDVNATGSALKNSLDFAKRTGQHYDFQSGSSEETNIIQIPSIFYGSQIKKGSVRLKFYVTGTLTAELQDRHHNGALIQYSGSAHASANDGETAGVVLYKEGFIILTGSWNLEGTAPVLEDKDYINSSVNTVPRWTRFAMGANDHLSGNINQNNASASFSIDFAGTEKVPTISMHAHANRGELNYSNNPTYIKFGQTASYHPVTSSTFYGESELNIRSIYSSSYDDPTGSLKKTTYITKVGFYDDKKKLIGIASVAKPVKKTEERDLTFKLKLDI